MKHLFPFLLALSCSVAVGEETTVDCKKVALSVIAEAKGKSEEQVLELVSSQVKASPKCSCEIIKGAIKGAKPSPQTVAAMVDRGIQAAPDYIDVILACAIAAAPDAFDQISAVAEKYGKSPNPLNFPGIIGTGPTGQYTFVSDTPVFVNPPQVTFVDP